MISFKNRDYYKELKKKKDLNADAYKKRQPDQDTRILVLQYNNTDGRAYYYYHRHIIQIIKKIQHKIRKRKTEEWPVFCPIECIVYKYMVEISSGFISTVTIDDIYKYIDFMSHEYKTGEQ